VSVQTLLQPFPEFGRVNMQQNSGGSSYFDSLNVRLEKRYSHGLSFLANYTCSKLIEKDAPAERLQPGARKARLR